MGVVRAALVLLLSVLCAACTAQADPPVPSSLSGVARDLDAFWQELLPEGQDAPGLVLLDGGRDTGCGEAVEDEGSFYCPQDETVYLQQADLDDLADEAPAVQRAWPVYLLAHEYAHSVQDRAGVDEGDAGPGRDGDSVRYELQADCLAGAYVATRDDAREVGPYQEVVRLAGDDAGEEPLAERDFEHGSSQQRLSAFTRGLRSGVGACDLERAAA